MKKRVYLIILLVLLSIQFTIAVSESTWLSYAGTETGETIWNKLIQFIDLSSILRYLAAITIIILVYLVLSIFKIPGGALVKIPLSLAVGIISTMFIRPEQIITLTLAYKATVVIIVYIIPILLLSFFSIQMVRNGEIKGIILQRVLWFFYAFILLVKSAIPFIVSTWMLAPDKTILPPTQWPQWIKLFVPETTKGLAEYLVTQTTTSILISAIAGIFIMFTIVIGNNKIVSMISKGITDSEASAMNIKAKKSGAYINSNAEQMSKE